MRTGTTVGGDEDARNSHPDDHFIIDLQAELI